MRQTAVASNLNQPRKMEENNEVAKKPNIENISETKKSSIFSNKRNIYFIGSIILLVIAYLMYSNF